MIVERFNALPTRWKTLVPYLFLVAAVFVAYGNIYGNALLFDDDLLINLNQNLLSWGSLGHLLVSSTTDGAHIKGGFYRPLQMLLYFLVYQINGTAPFLYHLLNVSLHAANACLLFALVRHMKFAIWPAFLGVLIWALHPIHTEAITYVSGTADPLFVLFTLAGLLFLSPDVTLRKVFCVIPIFLCALLSKETAIVFPGLVVCCLLLVGDNKFKWRTYLPTWPLWVLAFVYAFWRSTAVGFDGPATYDRLYQLPDYSNLKLYSEHFSLRLYTFFATLPAYAGLVFWPFNLHLERSFNIYSDFWQLLPLLGFLMLFAVGLQLVGATTQLVFHKRRQGLPLSWGFLWFGAAHFPDSGLLVAMNALFLEHWMYMPLMGLFTGTAQFISGFVGKPEHYRQQRILIGASLLLAVLLGIRTWDQNTVWHDPITFYNYIIDNGEPSARVNNNLALAYANKGDYVQAVKEFKRALATTDTYAETRHNLALSYLRLPDGSAHVQDAIDNLNRAIEIDPTFFRSYVALAQIYEHEGEHKKAEYYAQKADELMKQFGP